MELDTVEYEWIESHLELCDGNYHSVYLQNIDAKRVNNICYNLIVMKSKQIDSKLKYRDCMYDDKKML